MDNGTYKATAIFLAKGTATVGQIRTDKGGNIIEKVPSQFTFSKKGECVAIGSLDPETNLPTSISNVYGDWDAAGYLGKVLELMNPDRAINIPDFRAIIQEIWERRSVDVCEYCPTAGYACRDCIVNEWRSEK